MIELLTATTLLLALSGAVIGFLVGLTGVGAGALTTPLLISGFGVAPAIAVGTDLVFAALTKFWAGWRHASLGHIDWTVLGRLALGSCTGAVAALAYMHLADPDTTLFAKIISGTLAVALVISAAAMLAQPWLAARRERSLSGDGTARPSGPVPTMALGLLIGTLVTLTSVGAGAIGVVALMILYPLMSPRHIVGTDIAHAVPLAMIAGAGHAGLGNIDVALLATLLIGSVPGSLIGARFAGHVPSATLRRILAGVLLLAAGMLVFKVMR
ncbi:MAG: sulfite exporter TauE/SafE family protein [Hyphomicrobiaceae bacterium]|nr:sulfite exporter TauE/SafE family protein [Hyphomicrobiaceae bacterium]